MQTRRVNATAMNANVGLTLLVLEWQHAKNVLKGAIRKGKEKLHATHAMRGPYQIQMVFAIARSASVESIQTEENQYVRNAIKDKINKESAVHHATRAQKVNTRILQELASAKNVPVEHTQTKKER